MNQVNLLLLHYNKNIKKLQKLNIRK